jgi:aldose 1-epimerase
VTPTIDSVAWGEAHGAPVRLWTLASGRALRVRISNYGGVVQSVWLRDGTGAETNVALGFPSLADYVADFEQQPWPALGGSGAVYFGAIIGRYANRIAGHAFVLGGRTYELEGNDGPGGAHTLHSASAGWHRRVWSAEEVHSAHGASLQLRLDDPDGSGGFPGAVSAEVTYTVTDRDALRIDYRAQTTAPTVINLTNHTYFNLRGEGSGDVMRHEAQLNAPLFAPTDPEQIPLGGFVPVAGTPFDFRGRRPIGCDIRRTDLPWGEQLARARGYDHHFVLAGAGLRLAARVRDPASGRELLLATTAPGLQFYTANHLAGDLIGTGGRAYRAGDAFALETQHAPDSLHHQGEPGWPSVVLKPGDAYVSTTVLRFRAAG